MDCRVGKLSLASDRDSLHRAAAMVEDALRTASWPRLPPSALLVVKKVRLGKIQPARHSGSLATVISRELGDLVPVLVQEGRE